MFIVNPVSFILAFLIFGLALYRVCRMATRESGPFDIFLNFRKWIFARFGNGWLNEGVNCHFCATFWIGLPIGIYLGSVFYLDIVQTIALWLALSGFASWLYAQEK